MALRSFLVLRNTLLTLLCYFLAWIPPLPLLSCPRKLLASFSLLEGRRLFKRLWFIWLMYVRPLLWLLFDFNIPKWNPGFITCYTYVTTEIFTPPLWYRCKSQSRRSHSLRFVGMATGMDDGGVLVRVPVGSRIFTSPNCPDRFWGPPSLLRNGYRGLFPPR
jgi:hypothetical protein